MATNFSTLGLVIAAIQAQSNPAKDVTYTVVAQPASGNYAIQRNGVTTWTFVFNANVVVSGSGAQQPNPSGLPLSGAVTDSNVSGTILDLTSADGAHVRADAAVFINNLS